MTLLYKLRSNLDLLTHPNREGEMMIYCFPIGLIACMMAFLY